MDLVTFWACHRGWRVQTIWRTGDHDDHFHIGLRRLRLRGSPDLPDLERDKPGHTHLTPPYQSPYSRSPSEPLVCAECSQDDGPRQAETSKPALTAEAEQGTKRDFQGERAADPPVRIERAGNARLDRSTQKKLVSSTRRFAATLVDWLYGDRHEIDVEPVTRQVTRELATTPPYIPPDQLGSRDGQEVAVQGSVQTSRSGVLVVTVRDSRTSYAIPASLELRAGHWQVVHLNTH
jgi:hypothetical protein